MNRKEKSLKGPGVWQWIVKVNIVVYFLKFLGLQTKISLESKFVVSSYSAKDFPINERQFQKFIGFNWNQVANRYSEHN